MWAAPTEDRHTYANKARTRKHTQAHENTRKHTIGTRTQQRTRRAAKSTQAPAFHATQGAHGLRCERRREWDWGPRRKQGTHRYSDEVGRRVVAERVSSTSTAEHAAGSHRNGVPSTNARWDPALRTGGSGGWGMGDGLGVGVRVGKRGEYKGTGRQTNMHIKKTTSMLANGQRQARKVKARPSALEAQV